MKCLVKGNKVWNKEHQVTHLHAHRSHSYIYPRFPGW